MDGMLLICTIGILGVVTVCCGVIQDKVDVANRRLKRIEDRLMADKQPPTKP